MNREFKRSFEQIFVMFFFSLIAGCLGLIFFNMVVFGLTTPASGIIERGVANRISILGFFVGFVLMFGLSWSSLE